jgi:Na+:H+ antiporter, NhaA family
MRVLDLLQHRRVRKIAEPLQAFIQTEAFSGVILVAFAAIALAWANSPWKDSYENLFTTSLSIHASIFSIDEDVRQWIDDGLMVLFFVVIGLEIKREYSGGDLAGRAVMLPAIAAAGGMLVPALIYTAINVGGDGGKGWGIPMATDTAFALGVLALVPGVPSSTRVFLLAMAVVDDIGSIVVIALFYSGDIAFGWLAAAVALIAVMFAFRRGVMRSDAVFAMCGFFVWLFALKSGLSTAIAGVTLGLITVHRYLPDGSESPLTRRERVLHPISSYFIVPLFALANAGVQLHLNGDALGNSVTLGVLAARVVGKPLGVLAATFLAVRLGVVALPREMRFGQVLAVGVLAGIGFTVSLLVNELAFGEGSLADDAKLGIIWSALIAGAIGYVVLLMTSRSAPDATDK